MEGVSTRSVDDLVTAMGETGVSKSRLSRLCQDIDERVRAFLNRPPDGDWPLVWLDASRVKVRRDSTDPWTGIGGRVSGGPAARRCPACAFHPGAG